MRNSLVSLTVSLLLFGGNILYASDLNNEEVLKDKIVELDEVYNVDLSAKTLSLVFSEVNGDMVGLFEDGGYVVIDSDSNIVKWDKSGNYSTSELEVNREKRSVKSSNSQINSKLESLMNIKERYQSLNKNTSSYTISHTEEKDDNYLKRTYIKKYKNGNEYKKKIEVSFEKNSNECLIKYSYIWKNQWKPSTTTIENCINTESRSVDLPDGSIGSKYVSLPSEGSSFQNWVGVNAIANDVNMNNDYQCTELVNRFLCKIYKIKDKKDRTNCYDLFDVAGGNIFGSGKNVAKNLDGLSTGYIGGVGADNTASLNFGSNYDRVKLKYYKNNSKDNIAPVNGSIISQNAYTKNGHVAIAKRVDCSSSTKCTVYLFEQNWIYTDKDTKKPYISHSRTMTFTKKNNKWLGYDDKSNSVIGWVNPILE